jgi:prophage regulatory protein
MHASTIRAQQRRSELPPREYWDAPELSAKLGVNRTTIFRWVKAGKFPKPVYLTPTKPVWPDADYQAWCDERAAARDRAA